MVRVLSGVVLKRIFDFLVALTSLILLFPVILVVYILVLVKLGRPVLFVQTRPGLHGKSFNIYKFRTMRNVADNQFAMSDEARLLSFGKTLRKYSLDELPQLFNVIKGDLSLVGPRPLLMEYLPLYSPEQSRRHLVRPGITGWAQVNGRNAISWDEKFKLDVWYVDHHSFMLDLKILFLTVKKVFLSEGISAKGEVTMPKFTGNNSQ